jgi:hypothetical protein
MALVFLLNFSPCLARIRNPPQQMKIHILAKFRSRKSKDMKQPSFRAQLRRPTTWDIQP